MTQRVRIVSLTPVFGGGEIFILRLIGLLSRSIDPVVVGMPSDPFVDAAARQGVRAQWLTARRVVTSRLQMVWNEWRASRDARPRPVIILNGRGCIYLAPILRLVWGDRLLGIVHTLLSGHEPQTKMALFRQGLRNCRVVVCVSAHGAADLRARWPDLTIRAIPNWIDLDHASPAQHGRFTAADAAPEGGAVPIALVGRLEVAKGVLDAVDACRTIPGIRLDVYGDGPLMPRLRAAQGDESPWLELKGFRSDARDRLADYAVCVCPSHSEASPLYPLEALSAGTLCVLSRIPAHLELVGPDYPPALLFESGDPQALRAALVQAIDIVTRRPDVLGRTMQAVGRRIVERNGQAAARRDYLLAIEQAARPMHP